jgi:hypothetical protein
MILLGVARLGLSSAAVRRLAALAAATFVGYEIANLVTPTLVVPQRYAQYAIPVLVPLGLVAGLRGLFPAREREGPPTPGRARATTGFVLAVGTVVLLLFGGSGPLPRRDDYTLRRPDRPLYSAIKKLDESALIAGWPEGVMNQVPIATKRTAFLTQETHMPYHSEMTLLMRERMRALIAAYFATDTWPLRELVTRFGVTHLVVEWSHFHTPPSYFEPFDADLRRALHAARGQRYEVLELAERAAVFTDEKYALLDLSRIDERSLEP